MAAIKTADDLKNFNYHENSAFTIELRDSKTTLTCQKILRIVPQKRLVALATWQDRTVIAKIFFAKFSGARHAKRELKGARALQQAGIKTPEIYLYDRAKNNGGICILLFEYLADARALHRPVAINTLRNLMTIFAKQHNAGLMQQDPHLDNYLLCNNEIYCIDQGMIKTHRRSIKKSESLKNLGIFFARFPDRDLIAKVLPTYMKARGFKMHKKSVANIYKHTMQYKKHYNSKQLKKIFRDCGDIACQTDKKYKFLCYREYLAIVESLISEEPPPGFHIQYCKNKKTAQNFWRKIHCDNNIIPVALIQQRTNVFIVYKLPLHNLGN